MVILKIGFILSLLVILVLLHYTICFSRYWWPQLQIVPFKTVKTMQEIDVKPGDLILSRWCETSNPWSRVPWWHHVALVFRDAQGVIQVADFRPIPEQDPIYGTMHVTTPLEKILRSKPSTIFAVRQLTHPLSIEAEQQLLQAIIQHKNRTSDHYYVITYIMHQLGLKNFWCEVQRKILGENGDSRFEETPVGCSTIIFSITNQVGITECDPVLFPVHALHGNCNLSFTKKPFAYGTEVFVNKRLTHLAAKNASTINSNVKNIKTHCTRGKA